MSEAVFLPRANDGARFRLSRVERHRQRTATGSGFPRRPFARVVRRGWQRGAAEHIEEQFRTDTVMSRLSSTSRLCSVPRAALSQGSPSLAPRSLRRPDSNLSSSVCQTPLVSFTPVCC